MHIISLQPAANPGGGAMKHVATFDLQLSADVALYGMRLLQAPDGRHVSYAPTALGGRRAATFARPLAEAITAAALNSYSEHVTAHVTHSQNS